MPGPVMNPVGNCYQGGNGGQYHGGEQFNYDLFLQFQSWQASQSFGQGGCAGCVGGNCGTGYHQGGGNYHPKMVLEEKDFRRVDKFEGDPTKFRGWLFDVFTALNHVDSLLASDLHGLLARDAVNGKAENGSQEWTWSAITTDM